MASKKKQTAASRYANRIVGEGVEHPDNLRFNEANWRIHPRHQQRALDAVLKQVGWVQRVIVNKRTQNIVDGHMRVLLADRNGETEIPVVYVDLSEDEERAILATLDPIAEMAGTDKGKLDELLKSLVDSEAELQAALAEVAARHGLFETVDYEDAWAGMPSFDPETERGAYRSLIVHFKNEAEVEEFVKKVGVSIGAKTKTVWYSGPLNKESDVEYVDLG